ncbi:uncharacterized protein LOC142333249 isoform X3 [Lycorma delicatula]|uniref:uncharacterized protein LOC142333249 isoform X3 n=1 Tax=Lycorma delicatula TaxID=130591 RepID=UPI003F51A001
MALWLNVIYCTTMVLCIISNDVNNCVKRLNGCVVNGKRIRVNLSTSRKCHRPAMGDLELQLKKRSSECSG